MKYTTPNRTTKRVINKNQRIFVLTIPLMKIKGSCFVVWSWLIHLPPSSFPSTGILDNGFADWLPPAVELVMFPAAADV
jgi:hypothetical protein